MLKFNDIQCHFAEITSKEIAVPLYNIILDIKIILIRLNKQKRREFCMIFNTLHPEPLQFHLFQRVAHHSVITEF